MPTILKLYIKRTFYNEMVRFWGSLAEFAAYKIRGKLPEKNPKDLFLVKDLKVIFLFDIQDGR